VNPIVNLIVTLVSGTRRPGKVARFVILAEEKSLLYLIKSGSRKLVTN
jgi:hypothetical protein